MLSLLRRLMARAAASLSVAGSSAYGSPPSRTAQPVTLMMSTTAKGRKRDIQFIRHLQLFTQKSTGLTAFAYP